MPSIHTQHDAECALAVYENLMRRIKKFQAQLKGQEQLVLLVNDIQMEAVGVRGPTIWFVGAKTRTWTVQHYTQLNVVLAVKQLKAGKKPREIGFLAQDD